MGIDEHVIQASASRRSCADLYRPIEKRRVVEPLQIEIQRRSDLPTFDAESLRVIDRANDSITQPSVIPHCLLCDFDGVALEYRWRVVDRIRMYDDRA